MFIIEYHEYTKDSIINILKKNPNKDCKIVFNQRSEIEIDFLQKLVQINKNIKYLKFDKDEISYNEMYKLSNFIWSEICIIKDFVNIKTIEPFYSTIHYIYGLWDNHPMTQIYNDYIENTMKICFDFKHHILDKSQIYSLFNEKIYNIIEKIPRKVCIADIARYFVNYEYGGFYLDLDIQLFKHLGTFVNKDITLFVEHTSCNPLYMGQRENKKYTLRLYNCIFWSRPKQQFWIDCIDLCYERIQYLLANNVEWEDSDVLWATGPDVVTTIWHEKYKENDNVNIISAHKSTFRHECTGTWRNNKDKNQNITCI
jgi:mannosyltransferase OCH1-like enzyme